MLLELSPANGVPTPGEAGFRATDFLSDRKLGSSMLRSQDGAKFDYSKTHGIDQRELVALSRGVYTIRVLRHCGNCRSEACGWQTASCTSLWFFFRLGCRGPASKLGLRSSVLDQSQVNQSNNPRNPVASLPLRSDRSWHACLRSAFRNPPQLQFYIVNILKALVGIFRYARLDHPIKSWRSHGLNRRDGLGLGCQHCGDHASGCLTLESAFAGCHFVEHGAQRKDTPWKRTPS